MRSSRHMFAILYTALLVTSFFYVKNLLKEEKLSVKSIQEKEKVEDVKPVKVSLSIKGFNLNNNYQIQMKNTNTFDDLLEQLVKEKKLTYEKTEYTYGTEYGSINGRTTPEGYVWRVFEGEKEITYKTGGVKLIDGVNYSLVLSEK